MIQHTPGGAGLYQIQDRLYSFGVVLAVDFGLDEGENKAEWIRLEIELNGAKEKTVFMVPVYENNSEHSSFDEYKISAKERP